jgi:hypothetical protein
VTIAGAVALALQGPLGEPAALINPVSALMERADPGFARELRRLENWLSLPPAQAASSITGVGLAPPFSQDWDGISPFVVPSVIWSLYSFLRSPDDYWETICTAIAAGGDADTTAAMAGAISGAYLGLEAIPRDLAVRVNDQGAWGFDELNGLAERCLAVASAR